MRQSKCKAGPAFQLTSEAAGSGAMCRTAVQEANPGSKSIGTGRVSGPNGSTSATTTVADVSDSGVTVDGIVGDAWAVADLGSDAVGAGVMVRVAVRVASSVVVRTGARVSVAAADGVRGGVTTCTVVDGP